MDVLTCGIEVHEDREIRVTLFVNGEKLGRLASRVESPLMAREGHPSDGQDRYYGIPRVLLDYGHFLGAPGSDLSCGARDKTLLACCECGERGCWPLMARIVVSDDTVRWVEFEQPHRKAWDFAGLGPFEFLRSDYERALAEAGLG